MKILKIMKKSMTPSWIFNKNYKYEHKSSQKAQHYDYDNKYNFKKIIVHQQFPNYQLTL